MSTEKLKKFVFGVGAENTEENLEILIPEVS